MFPDWLTRALILFGFLSVVLGPLLILLLPDLGRHRFLHGMFTRLALKGAGRLDDVNDGPMPVPRLTAQGGGRTLTVMPDVPNEDDLPGSILFEVPGPLPLPRLEVHPRDPAARAELAGLAPVSLCDTLMDRDYAGLVSDPTAWERMAPRLAPALERLGHTGERPAFALSASPRRLQIRRLSPPKDDPEMEALLVRAAELVEALIDTGAAPAASSPAPEACHHCGEPLARVELRCRRCHTAYHSACFRGAGGCTLYPCTCATPITDPDAVLMLAPGQT